MATYKHSGQNHMMPITNTNLSAKTAIRLSKEKYIYTQVKEYGSQKYINLPALEFPKIITFQCRSKRVISSTYLIALPHPCPYILPHFSAISRH